MDFFEVATSTPTMRRFLDARFQEAELVKILETANMAPSGSNAQPWEFVVVRDARSTPRNSAAVRGGVGAVQGQRNHPRPHDAVGARGQGDQDRRRVRRAAGDRPVHVVVFLDRPKMRVERGSAEDLFNFGATYGSIFPAIELMMLAARALGIGTAMTTMLSSREPETKACSECRSSIS